ncbi:MAG: DUF192 domain-containing protein [Cyanobacteria bacterium CRU_2_1]|nr:DUF192 domain-containing protein [Cyanobacteria bacterium RU_5_0]NJR58933.1 DUF192 domain-containing protein [Cyanobacteria bacterium CRU_2_1]
MNHSWSLRVVGMGLCALLLGCAPSSVVSSPMESNMPSEVGQATPPSDSEQGQMLSISAEAIVGNQVIQLEVARTPQEQAMGLMFRSVLPDDRGMLFPFEPPRSVNFWMKNVPVALDMVFLRDGEVKAIAASVPPCDTNPCPTYGPQTPIDQVIELRSGRAAELGLEVGDRVEIRFLE